MKIKDFLIALVIITLSVLVVGCGLASNLNTTPRLLVNGVLYDSDSNPIQNHTVKIDARNIGGFPRGTVKTNSSGRYSFEITGEQIKSDFEAYANPFLMYWVSATVSGDSVADFVLISETQLTKETIVEVILK